VIWLLPQPPNPPPPPVSKFGRHIQRLTKRDNLLTELKSRDDIPLLLEGKKSFLTALDGIYLPGQLTDWPLVDLALLLIGLT
jgi:hypothetical protein